jgi:hypothetical protein
MVGEMYGMEMTLLDILAAQRRIWRDKFPLFVQNIAGISRTLLLAHTPILWQLVFSGIPRKILE